MVWLEAGAVVTGHRGAAAWRVEPVRGVGDRRRFERAGAFPYRDDANWVPPLPGDERAMFDSRRNPSLEGVESARWVLMSGRRPVGRVAAFAPGHRPGVGYVGCFECSDDPAAARLLLDSAIAWLGARGRMDCFGPINVSPRDRIGMLTDGFGEPPMLFTPYNPPYYPALFEAAGWLPHLTLSAYGWKPAHADQRGLRALAERAARHSSTVIRPIQMDRLAAETEVVASLINTSLAEAWHFDPISRREAVLLAGQLRPIIDPTIALIAEDAEGPCGVALAVPDANWLWRRAGGRLWPMGWARMLRLRHSIPQIRLMVLGVAPRVRGHGLAARLMQAVIQAAVDSGYRRGEISQVYDDNTVVCSMVDAIGFPVVRRYAVMAHHREVKSA